MPPKREPPDTSSLRGYRPLRPPSSPWFFRCRCSPSHAPANSDPVPRRAPAGCVCVLPPFHAMHALKLFAGAEAATRPSRHPPLPPCPFSLHSFPLCLAPHRPHKKKAKHSTAATAFAQRPCPTHQPTNQPTQQVEIDPSKALGSLVKYRTVTNCRQVAARMGGACKIRVWGMCRQGKRDLSRVLLGVAAQQPLGRAAGRCVGCLQGCLQLRRRTRERQWKDRGQGGGIEGHVSMVQPLPGGDSVGVRWLL